MSQPILESIGCPSETVRDILQQHTFETKRLALKALDIEVQERSTALDRQRRTSNWLNRTDPLLFAL